MSRLDTLQISPAWDGRRYDIVAWARDQELVYYDEFGGYEGEWLLVSRDLENFYVYKDWYGSCSGCDSFEAEWFDRESEQTRDKAIAFAQKYRPFAVIPSDTMSRMASRIDRPRSPDGSWLAPVLPRNITGFGPEDSTRFAQVVEARVRLIFGLPVTARYITAIPNSEVQQEWLQEHGYTKFMDEMGADVRDAETTPKGVNQLLDCGGGIVFVSVVDSTTAARYLLRVPPNVRRVREAVAWTFDLDEAQYKPIIET